MRIFLVAILLMGMAGGALAAEDVQQLCGPPPVVSDSAWATEVEGEAHVISKLLGGAEGKVKVNKWQSDIFSKYPNADRTRVNAYMQYNLCAAILQDEGLSPQEKVDLLLRGYEALQTGPMNQSSLSGSVGDVSENARVFQNNFSISVIEREAKLSSSHRSLLTEIAGVVSEAVNAANSDNVDQDTTDRIAQALSDIVKEVPLNDYMVGLDTFEIVENHAFFLKGTDTTLSVRSIGDNHTAVTLNGRNRPIYVGGVVEMKNDDKTCRLLLHEVRKDEKKAVFSYICND